MASSAERSAELRGRRVVLAGATGGIGRAVASRLAAAGAGLVLVARRRAPLDALAAELGASAMPADTADAAAVRDLAARAEAAGPVDVLVNAAGDFDLAPVAETEPAMFDRMLDANLRAPFLLIRAFLPGMLARGDGVVVTIGSVSGRVPFPGNGAYSASKYGVRGLHAVLQQELRGSGVRCTLIDPAATDTPIWNPIDPDGRDDLPSRSSMLSADAVADAVLYTVTRPPSVHIPAVSIQRS